MTQEEKDLLLQDLCSRLLFKPVCSYPYGNAKLINIDVEYEEPYLVFDSPDDNDYPLDGRIKPYLSPMSSMSEEEWDEYNHLKMHDWVLEDENATFINAGTITGWLNSHHFDYRGLIEKGLALEAPEGMYKI